METATQQRYVITWQETNGTPCYVSAEYYELGTTSLNSAKIFETRAHALSYLLENCEDHCYIKKIQI